MTDTRASIIRLIDDCINLEEGGWKLTSNSNDPDGGWTFAGVTSTTWREYYKIDEISHDDMAHHIAANFDSIENTVYTLYTDVFYKPLYPICRWDIEGYRVHPAVFSAAVNLGVPAVSKMLEKMEFVDYKLKNFLKHWQDYYVDLVLNNVEAWENYSGACASAIKSGEAYSVILQQMKPKEFRAAYLRGWLNRIERYRP